MQHDASSPAKDLHRYRLQTLGACVISAGQAPNLMVPTLVANVKRPLPRNPRVRVATTRCRDAKLPLVHGQGKGTKKTRYSPALIALNRL